MSQTTSAIVVQLVTVCLFTLLTTGTAAPTSVLDDAGQRYKITAALGHPVDDLPLYDSVPLIESVHRAKMGNSKRFDALIRYESMLSRLENELKSGRRETAALQAAPRAQRTNWNKMAANHKGSKVARRINRLPKRDAGQICIWKVCPPSPWRRLY